MKELTEIQCKVNEVMKEIDPKKIYSNFFQNDKMKSANVSFQT